MRAEEWGRSCVCEYVARWLKMEAIGQLESSKVSALESQKTLHLWSPLPNKDHAVASR